MQHAALVNASRFTWNRQAGLAVAEASDLYDAPRIEGLLRDGILTQSVSTGRMIPWKHVDTLRDADGDVMVWIFQPVVHEGLRPPTFMEDWKLHIYND